MSLKLFLSKIANKWSWNILQKFGCQIINVRQKYLSNSHIQQQQSVRNVYKKNHLYLGHHLLYKGTAFCFYLYNITSLYPVVPIHVCCWITLTFVLMLLEFVFKAETTQQRASCWSDSNDLIYLPPKYSAANLRNDVKCF